MNKQPVRKANSRDKSRMLEKSIMGYKAKPSQEPPTYVKLPWNSYTYEKVIAAQTQTTIVAEDIFADLATSIGLRKGDATGNADIRVKVERAQCWASTTLATSVPSLKVDFYEISAGPATGQYPRSTQSDRGTPLYPARAGYVYPVADRKQVLGGTEGNSKLLTISPGASTTSTVRIHVLWNSAGA